MTGDSGSEAESWANAGRQFILAEEKLMAARNVSYNDMLEAGIHSFLLAVHVSCSFFIGPTLPSLIHVQCSLFIKDTIGPTLPVLNTCTV